MTITTRLRTPALAAALSAALVLAPVAAFADEPAGTSPAPAESGAPTPSDAETAAAPGDTTSSDAPPADTAPVEAAPGDATPVEVVPVEAVSGNTAVGSRPPAATAAEPAPAGSTPSATPSAGTPPTAGPSPTGDGTVVVVEPDVVPAVDIYPTVAHAGGSSTVYVDDFTGGDPVSVRVDGDAVEADDVFTVLPWESPFAFDPTGSALFDVVIPDDLPLGDLVVTVSDAHGVSVSADLAVTPPLPVPAVTVPQGATAGVVTISGAGAQPGSAAFVVVGDPADLAEGFGSAVGGSTGATVSWSVEGSGLTADEADSDDPTDEADPTEEAGPADEADPSDPAGDEAVHVGDDIVVMKEQADDPANGLYDTEPVPYDATDGPAQALVPVAADGTFEARFVLPEGRFSTTASTIDLETGDASDQSAVASFSVAAASAVVPAAPVATPVAATGGVVVVGRSDRAGRLAYTGTDGSGTGAAIAAGLLLLGGGLVAAARLRVRRRP
ncbi:hypothetical protein EDF38_0494 [Frigoribacterium sp. PhB160]|uniref:hypothetical protein n=1 Tax=Frigoribacterium sp. PhB160 TaxID=2485192 RepID=UPI000F495F1D|nr:hypothetical protein [Frigoribacterium sp. PhB160]ROS61404.1 hypothetical protein EDF38_0494 [Frigoribacterium sp. PhB160]